MITINGRPNCPYCKKAVELCKKTGTPYTYIDLSIYEDTLKAFKAQGHSTVPIIFEDGRHIGGYTELVPYLEAKEADSEDWSDFL